MDKTLPFITAYLARVDEIKKSFPFPLLPTEVVKGEETETIAGFTVPRFNDVTTGEQILYEIVLLGLAQEQGQTEEEKSAAIMGLLPAIRLISATILMASRYDVNWTVEKTFALKSKEVEALHDFFTRERFRGNLPAGDNEPIAEVEPDSEKKLSGDGEISIGVSENLSLEKPDLKPVVLEAVA